MVSNPETPKTGSDLVVSASAHVVEARIAAVLAPIVGIAAANECASVVAALPDIAIVELPAMDAPNSWSPLPGFRNPVELTPLDRYPIRHSGDVITNAEGACYLAARLLAAVRAAGGQA